LISSSTFANYAIQAFASVNIDDSRHMHELTIATVRDSAAMKQISYLTMVFLPANFIANVFSMNVVEINPSGQETLGNYIASAISLTVFAAWVAIALQVESRFFVRGSPAWRRAGWPVFYVWDVGYLLYRQRFGGKRKTT
jgi:Mg2+ and Co2+ transporter CorA